MPENLRSAVVWFAAICFLSLMGIVTIILVMRSEKEQALIVADPQVKDITVRQNPPAAAAERQAHRIYFRYNAVDMHYGQLAYRQLDGSSTTEFVDQLSCLVVHASGGRGLCLATDGDVMTTYKAFVFDTRTHDALGEFSLSGIPSRTRVSPNGRIGATTIFVAGHGYDLAGFSTKTLLIDLERAEPMVDLETFEVSRDGQVIQGEDFNFWGVTFTPDSLSFFATLATDGEHYLIRGDIAARTAQIVHKNVECPSLSPDGTRIAYKRRRDKSGPVVWALYVLTLETGVSIGLADDRNIDDQLEWLDNEHVLYSAPSETSRASTDIWVADADGAGTPRLYLKGASSPAVARAGD